MRVAALLLLVAGFSFAGIIPSRKKAKEPEPSLLDQYIRSASERPEERGDTTPGAVWSSSARLTDLGRDLRASQVDDVVTVVVSESVNAVATGASTSARTSSAKASLNSLAGKKTAAGALVNLADLGGEQKLNGTGTTTRAATLNAT